MGKSNDSNKYVNINDFEYLQLLLMSPEDILNRSYGEVKNPETINYKSGKAEKDGLFCERIFGPTKDWTCSCGKYTHAFNMNKECENCGTLVTKSIVRRERFGHIELEAPVVHIVFLKSNASILGTILDMQLKVLEKIIYFVSYIVIDPKDTPYKKYEVLGEKAYKEAINQYGKDGIDISIGGEAILKMLQELDLDEEISKLEEKLARKRDTKQIRRMEILKGMKNNNIKPEWIVLKRIPVLPPDMRPMIQISGGRYATSDANDLYRRVITRNKRLAKLIETRAPQIITRNEKRILQEAVDCLFANGKRGNPVTATNGRAFKSISDSLNGKKGVFRLNLLGKRVDYSGRSVIVVGPELKMNQCGLPKKMALELYKPYVIRELMQREIVSKIKTAKKMIETFDNRVWDILEEVVVGRPVLLNRAPSLHRLSIQGFDVVLIDGEAIRLHPLVCSAYNADFDGDQMAVHLPLSKEAIQETYEIMLAPHNILNPKDGQTVAVPSQDMVIGLYYLTMEEASSKIKVYQNGDEAKKAYELGHITLHQRIVVKSERVNKKVVTTVGKIIFSEIFPIDFDFVNDALFKEYNSYDELKSMIESTTYPEPFAKKGNVKEAINRIYDLYDKSVTVNVLDSMKSLGYKYATIAAVTIGMDDIIIPDEKATIIEETEKKIDYINSLYRLGFLTDDERYQSTVDLWTKESNRLTNIMMSNYEKNHRKNPLYMMVHSGARGSKDQVKQLSSMRGLMANTLGNIIEFPIKANFKEGINILDFFISSHGARKGGVDTALKTGDSGYLTRRLVDVAQSVVIQADDCGTENSVIAKEVVNDGTTILTLFEAICGKYSAEEIKTFDGEVIVGKNELITKPIAQRIVKEGFKEVRIRSVRTCAHQEGLCRKCYGADLATWKPVKIGTAVGIIAAQSIGEPGTQLTMRTFHTGGIAGADITQGLPRVEQLVEVRIPTGKKPAFISPIDGIVSVKETDKDKKIIIKNEEATLTENIPVSMGLLVKDGDNVKRGDILTTGALELQNALDLNGKEFVEDYIVHEILKVYAGEGVKIDTKHIEIIVRQMMKKVIVTDIGDSNLIQGQEIDIDVFENEVERLKLEGGELPTMQQLVTGITKISTKTKSFLSAASFQEAMRVLPDAAIKGSVDRLMGPKENLIIGRIIPAGTGFEKHKDITSEERYLDL